MGRLHAPERARFNRPAPRASPLFRLLSRAQSMLRLQSCVLTIHIAFSRKREHGFSASATEALSSWPRSPWFAAPGLVRPYGARAAAWLRLHGVRSRQRRRSRAHAAAAKPVCLNAAETREYRQVAPPARAVRGAQVRRRATQGRGAVGEALPHRRRFRLRDHPLASGRAPRACRDGGCDGKNRVAPGA